MYENPDDDDAVELEDVVEEDESDVDFPLEELLPCEFEELPFEFSEDDEPLSEELDLLPEEDDSVSEVSFSGDEAVPSPLQANSAIAMDAMIGLIRNFFIGCYPLLWGICRGCLFLRCSGYWGRRGCRLWLCRSSAPYFFRDLRI